MVATVLRLVALPVLAFAFFIAYTHSLPIAQSLLPAASDVGVGTFIVAVCALTAALAALWAIVFALPFSWLYRRRAAAAALVCVAPILIVTWVKGLGPPPTSPLAWLPAAFLCLTLLIIVPLVAHITFRVLNRNAGKSV